MERERSRRGGGGEEGEAKGEGEAEGERGYLVECGIYVINANNYGVTSGIVGTADVDQHHPSLVVVRGSRETIHHCCKPLSEKKREEEEKAKREGKEKKNVIHEQFC